MTMTEPTSTAVHRRSFPAAVEFNEGRVFARLVPYGAVADVADLTSDGKIEQYTEGFRKGAFDRQMSTSEPGVLQRVLLTHEHGGDRLGPLVSLEEKDDGLYGEFRVLPSRRDDVVMLSDVGVRELSVEFMERKGGTVVEDGVRWRTDVHLHGAALVARGAYGVAGAGILAMRSLDDLAAEQAEAAAKARADAEAAEAEAAAKAKADAEADQLRQRRAQAAEWLAEQEKVQAELAARYK